MRKGTYDEALKDAEKAIKIKPKYAKGHVRKAAALHAMKKYDEEIVAIKEGLKICPDDSTLKQGLEAAKRNTTSKGKEAADKAKDTKKKKDDFNSGRKTRTGKKKEVKTVSQFVAETKKILELQMAALQAQLDMVNELTRMTIKEKLDLLFSLMDKDGDGSIDAKELAAGLRKQNDGLSFSGSIEKSIEMIAIFDDDGDAELDREEFEHFVEKMVSFQRSGLVQDNSFFFTLALTRPLQFFLSKTRWRNLTVLLMNLPNFSSTRSCSVIRKKTKKRRSI